MSNQVWRPAIRAHRPPSTRSPSASRAVAPDPEGGACRSSACSCSWAFGFAEEDQGDNHLLGDRRRVVAEELGRGNQSLNARSVSANRTPWRMTGLQKGTSIGTGAPGSCTLTEAHLRDRSRGGQCGSTAPVTQLGPGADSHTRNPMYGRGPSQTVNVESKFS